MCTKTTLAIRATCRYATRRSLCSSANSGTAKSSSTVNEEELRHFRRLSASWWNQSGDLMALHSMNRLRVPLIRNALSAEASSSVEPLTGLKILDVGCGGGVLTEPLARLGASVTGLDVLEENVAVATMHADLDPTLQGRLTYVQSTVEDMAEEMPSCFDAVVASEVVEHVNEQTTFVGACCHLVKPGGSLFMTTLNKTWASYLLGIVAAEKLLRVVPDGTHDWEKFISPATLQEIAAANGCETRLLHGMYYNPLSNRWRWGRDTSISYAMHMVKAAAPPSVDDKSSGDGSS
ncbi:PREDICTED: ubiquinone biosynthesis O-methyltransferase, mitochondrial-like [Priapulus caudatus]|uniref:Ubiquinone biosynthesis O-methyltransferase, mitochondrial n=1 Tax=Priapulus caudatus TaxID=37621 RepID=A0ABM1ER05_PRICU|nr:PREDICTED: ubiquinone biosynthesis O-methyltransferase, mitochondrial-like [Priapulus caudatus]